MNGLSRISFANVKQEHIVIVIDGEHPNMGARDLERELDAGSTIERVDALAGQLVYVLAREVHGDGETHEA